MILAALSLLCLLAQTDGHGRLLHPPGRSTLWRFGFNTPRNSNDHSLSCGGFGVQFYSNHGKCGLCGDPYNTPVPRDNEAGGKYGKGVIGQTFKQGGVMPITVDITVNHGGWSEFQLCPVNDPAKRSSEECFHQYTLTTVDGLSKVPITLGLGPQTYQLRLPKDLSCSQCVLRWRWNTASNVACAGGKCCRGCGNQEQFYGCADIAINPDKQSGGSVGIDLGPIYQQPTTKAPENNYDNNVISNINNNNNVISSSNNINNNNVISNHNNVNNNNVISNNNNNNNNNVISSSNNINNNNVISNHNNVNNNNVISNINNNNVNNNNAVHRPPVGSPQIGLFPGAVNEPGTVPDSFVPILAPVSGNMSPSGGVPQIDNSNNQIPSGFIGVPVEVKPGCQATEFFKKSLTNADEWCVKNCQPASCPTNLCTRECASLPSANTIDSCKATPLFRKKRPDADAWCRRTCALGFCPLSYCDKACTI